MKIKRKQYVITENGKPLPPDALTFVRNCAGFDIKESELEIEMELPLVDVASFQLGVNKKSYPATVKVLEDLYTATQKETAERLREEFLRVRNLRHFTNSRSYLEEDLDTAIKNVIAAS